MRTDLHQFINDYRRFSSKLVFTRPAPKAIVVKGGEKHAFGRACVLKN